MSINYDKYSSSTGEIFSLQKTMLFVPIISDGSATDEWRSVV